MALQISTYVDPGVYIQEVIAPGALNLQTLPVLPTLIANGSRSRRQVNEDIVRGLVVSESMTVAGSSPHTATLANQGDRKLANTIVFADGVALSSSFISYPAATLTGTVLETFNLSTNNAFVLSMDGKAPITITLEDGAAAVAVVGTEVQVTTPLSSAAAAATAAEVAAGINAGLVAATAFSYGPGYASAASVSGGAIVLTSPTAGLTSDITISAAITTNASAALFGTALKAATVIRIADAAWDDTAVYTVNYINVTDVVDTVVQANPQTFVRVGAFPGVTTYRENVDFSIPSPGTLNWSTALSSATVTGVDGSTDFNLSTNDTLRIALDGKAAVDLDLDDYSPVILGYADPAVPVATTPNEVANNINALLANNINYGPAYKAVATVVNDRVVLTSPTSGRGGSVTIFHAAALDATAAIFGLGPTQTLTVTGTGLAPVPGSTYFATYSYARPAADYNAPRQFFTLEQALAFTGPVSSSNPLALATEITFRNGAPSVMLIQVNDASNPGSPIPVEFQVALDAAAVRSTATDLVVLDTNLDTQARLIQHIEDQSGPIEQNFRRGYFGMPVNTPIGDIDTPDSYVFRAANTLQVAADSPARGRLMLVSPPGIEGIRKTFLLEDGTTDTVRVDSTYIACGIVGRLASFASPADALVRTAIGGFDAAEADFTPWVRSERAQLASNGVTVLTFDAGRFLLLDPCSTERAGGGLIQFEQWSSSIQKDNIVRQVRSTLDANVVGIVPVDVADFIIDVKQFIANVLTSAIAEGAIGPFVDANGNRRAIDLNQDIVVEQSPTDPTQYNFNFFFNLRYPALRLFGQYSVENPFASQTA